MKYYLNQTILPDEIEAGSYDEATQKIMDMVDIVSEEDLE